MSPGRHSHPPAGDGSGPITMFEAVAYTTVLGLIAALALGWFNAMIATAG
jgi:hypothetical protein